MKLTTVKMTRSRETKNTYRFDAEGDEVCDAVYLRKRMFTDGKAPEAVYVTFTDQPLPESSPVA